MFKRVLVSVSDKSGLVPFLKKVLATDGEIVSTGGTAKSLREAQMKVTEVADVTGFPEMMDGRVRTLHPKIHMALLARSFVHEDLKTLREYEVEPFDLVVVNLYPFEEAYKKGLKGLELVEKIDVGGPSMLRAAAKSFERLTVICDPQDYDLVVEKMKSGQIDEFFRQQLAAKVFSHCAYYDGLVAEALKTDLNSACDSAWDAAPNLTLSLKKKSSLRYGENPHQKAVWYETALGHRLSLAKSEILQGKELSYNNIVDLEAAVGAVVDFREPACVIVKHATPCGVALGNDIQEAYQKAFDSDSVSAFGGIVALNETIDENLAKLLIGPFLECVIAPQVTAEAKTLLASKKNLRVLLLAGLGHHSASHDSWPDGSFEFKSLRGGALAQSLDTGFEWSDQFKIIMPHKKPSLSESEKADLIFAQRVVRHVKSNAIVVVKNRQTLGICGGQTNRIDSARLALERAMSSKSSLIEKQTDFVLASDAFFPFRDSIDLAAAKGVKWVIQPGGSLRDQEVETAAQEHGLGMVITGTRHFRH